ncbi:MAG: sigma-70 family RNA polymerase sigma factor [Gemmataceae bacterium]
MMANPDSTPSFSELPSTSMQALVSDFQRGNLAATNQLFARAQERMLSIARSMLRRYPRVGRWVQEEDVVQEAMVRLLRALRSIKPESIRSFYGLAAEQIRRELIDLTRKLFGPEGAGSNHESHLINQADGQQSSPVAEPVAPTDTLEELERWNALHRAIEELESKLREVFSLTFYHGWGQREIAELMQVDERTVRRWWRRAVLQLTDQLGGRLPTDIHCL